MVPDKVCQECGAARECVHHIIPLYKGGKNELSNLVALCKACHRKKHPNLPSFMFY